jgi:hypothetical protein
VRPTDGAEPRRKSEVAKCGSLEHAPGRVCCQAGCDRDIEAAWLNANQKLDSGQGEDGVMGEQVQGRTPARRELVAGQFHFHA